MMAFSKFLNFFAIFLELSITGRAETQRNDFFYLLSFAGFPNLFWLVKKLRWCLLIFFNFFAIFIECSITGREETQRNDLLPFLSFVAFPNLFWLETKL